MDINKQTFYFYHPVHFEKWDYRNSVTKGIGGSETSQVEMAWRLARRGHKVICYAPIPKDCPREWRGTIWKPLATAKFNAPGIWVLYRCPDKLDKFKKKHPRQQVWLMMQDESYPTWTKERAAKVDKVLALCPQHLKSTIKRNPYLKDKLIQTSNGVKMELIRQVEKSKIVRNPKKLIYASSPDRGLANLLKIFKRAREYDPKLELHVFYGFNNINKLIGYQKRFGFYKRTKEEILELLKQPNVYFRGRVSQVRLYKEWLSAGIWCYPTNFTETSCITSMEAQALGAIPITNPLWALEDNVMSGTFIDGDAYDDRLVIARYTAEIVRIASTPEGQEMIRPTMMRNARGRFNWERWVDQWESWIYGFDKGLYISQFNFQLKNAKGKILNVGCDIDPANLKKIGAVNVDIVKISPILKLKTKADIIADARKLPRKLWKKFDTVILGDILEHMNNKDILSTLLSAKKCLSHSGDIVITCPNDPRPVEAQHKVTDNEGYAEGISSYHERPISIDHLSILIVQAGMKVKYYQEIDYTDFLGHGVICS